MRKEKLRALRTLNATKTMMKYGKRFEERTETSYYDSRKYIRLIPEYDLLVRVQNLQGYIKVALFLPEKMRKDIITPIYEIFINLDGNEYITRELDDEGNEKRWLTAMVMNLKGINIYGYYSSSEPKIYISNDGKSTLNNLKLDNDTGSKGINRLQIWQQEQKDKDTARREQRQQAPWDADMKLIPKVLQGFSEWMRMDVASEYFIIYKYESKGARIGYCSRCKREVPIINPKHGVRTTCPKCKASALFKSSGKIKTLSVANYEAELIQKFDGGIVIRSFSQSQYYRGHDFKSPHINTHEYMRIMIFDNGDVKRYEWGMYKNKFHRWIPGEKRYWLYREPSKIYKKNLWKLKANSILKQSAIDMWDTLPLPASRYLEVERGNPAVEMLARIGMFRLAKDIVYSDYDSSLLKQDETELAKILKVDKARLKRLNDMDANKYMLKWIQYEKFQNTIWPDEMIKDFGNEEILISDLNFLNTPISYVKCYNYLKKQAGMMGEGLHQALTTWRDYIYMAEQMKMNTSLDQIMKPKDLKYAHDELVFMSKTKGIDKQAKSIEKKFPEVNKHLPKLKKFEFTLGEYSIVAPSSILDIVTEGVVLSHCVHTCDYYFSRIQTDESYLFFLRHSKHPDIPWYTLEVEPSGNIRQKRTTGDNQNPDFEKALPFLKKWQQYFKKQLTEEEIKLGTIANNLRKENYEQLRKNGNRVWHGKLQGQLLADVLEADFMEAI